MKRLYAPWMYRTGTRKHILCLQKTTQSRPLRSYSSSTDWKARSRRTTNHLLKSSMKPGLRTRLLNWMHQYLLRYFIKQLNILPTLNIPQEKCWHGTCIPEHNLNPKMFFTCCVKNVERNVLVSQCGLIISYSSFPKQFQTPVCAKENQLSIKAI